MAGPQGLVGAAAGSQQVARAIEHFFRESVAGAEPLRPGASAAVPSQLLTAARPGSIAPSTLRRILQVRPSAASYPPPTSNPSTLPAAPHLLFLLTQSSEQLFFRDFIMLSAPASLSTIPSKSRV